MATDGTSKRIAFIDISNAMHTNRARAVIGLSGVALVTAVALRQDKLRCPGKPVVFYATELMDAMNTRNPVTFRRARDKAIAAGWLAFIPGSTRSPGQYSAQIAQGYSPDSLETSADYVTHSDTHCDTYLNTYSDTLVNSMGTLMGTHSQSLSLASPIPSPKIHPEINSGSATATAPDEPAKPKKKRKPVPYSQDFTAWCGVYPRQESKGAAQKAFDKAIEDIVANRGMSRPEALEWLLLVTAAYAKTPAGQAGQYTPHPATWLNGKKYDDNYAAWSASTASPGVTYDPNAGKHDPTFGTI